jgi:hypothetical protein
MRAVTESGIAIELNEDGTWAPAKLGGGPLPAEGFRKASWGASLSEVKASEGGDPHQETVDYLDFEVRLGRFSCLAVYIFVGDQLVRGKYLLLEEYQNRTTHLNDYDELKTSISKKYGLPMKDATYWLDDLYKDDYSHWGTAVGCGHLSMFAHWETAESEINVALYGENFDVTVSVEYAGKAFAGLEDAAKESQILGDL